MPSLINGDLCRASESDNYEVFGVPIRAKQTARRSGQIASCLRPLARIFHEGLDIDEFLLFKRNGSGEIAMLAIFNAGLELKTSSSAL